eukprot:512434_1
MSEVFKLITGRADEYTVDMGNIDIFRSVLSDNWVKHSAQILHLIRNQHQNATELVKAFNWFNKSTIFSNVNIYPGVFVRPFDSNENCLQSKKGNWVEFR